MIALTTFGGRVIDPKERLISEVIKNSCRSDSREVKLKAFFVQEMI